MSETPLFPKPEIQPPPEMIPTPPRPEYRDATVVDASLSAPTADTTEVVAQIAAIPTVEDNTITSDAAVPAELNEIVAETGRPDVLEAELFHLN